MLAPKAPLKPVVAGSPGVCIWNDAWLYVIRYQCSKVIPELRVPIGIPGLNGAMVHSWRLGKGGHKSVCLYVRVHACAPRHMNIGAGGQAGTEGTKVFSFFKFS